MSRISVIQPGARLHYAVPEIFARAGLLKRLYTDMHAEHGWLRVLDSALPASWQPRMLRRLLGRRLPRDLPARLVDDMALSTMLRDAAGRLRLSRPPTCSAAQHLLDRLEAADLGPGDVVYTVLVNEDIEVMRRLKARGVRIVHECMIGPDVGLWLHEERKLYPGVERQPETETAIEIGRARDREKYALADLVLVPSEFVREAVLGLGCEPGKIRLVPYGLDARRFADTRAPQPGRILCVGSVGLRKGHHYLAAAARILAETRSDIEIRVVGPANSGVIAHSLFSGPRYVGQVPRATVAEEYYAADVLVLPTLCDSFALVQLEAMAAGLPVITTPNCGSVVRDAVDGFIVPIRDPEAIAERIRWIVDDRTLRETMSVNARARAWEFSLDRYAERLLGAVRPLLDS